MLRNRADRARTAFAGLFIALLLLPTFQMLTGVVPIKALDENRNRAALPPLAFADLLSQFPKLQAWFQDHYGFRDVLIRANAQIDFSLFGVSNRVHVGQDGWLYYRDSISNQLRLEEEFNEEKIELVAKKG